MSTEFLIDIADAGQVDALVPALAEVLIDCVAGGASVGFMHPLSRRDAERFWAKVLDDVAAGERILLVAREPGSGRVVGTVQLVVGQMPNQPHRADVSKMLVHRDARRQGLGTALMRRIEQLAQDAHKTVLVLDTAVGGDAESLYERLDWESVGQIPDYALLPEGGFCATRIFYKRV
jgi:GNAT superfamily N-acetyltransferase